MMKTSMRTWLAAAIAAGMFGCAQFAGISTLRGADAATPDQAGDVKPYVGKRPGSGQPIARTFDGQPPLVPHAVDNFDEITVAENQCLDCHGPQVYAKKNAPKMSDAHVLAAAGGAHSVRMDRYQCNSCHVPQVDAKPLVASTFVGKPPAAR
jgi:nitrate reductase (cytochrome), electron transfer subunit